MMEMVVESIDIQSFKKTTVLDSWGELLYHFLPPTPIFCLQPTIDWLHSFHLAHFLHSLLSTRASLYEHVYTSLEVLGNILECVLSL